MLSSLDAVNMLLIIRGQTRVDRVPLSRIW
jgi:hypothetical protein